MGNTYIHFKVKTSRTNFRNFARPSNIQNILEEFYM